MSVPFTAFALPFIVYLWLNRTKEARADPALAPPKLLRAGGWAPIFTLCVLGIVIYAGFGFTAVAYSLKSIYDNAQTFGLFARCYQCPTNYVSLLKNAANGL